MNRVFSWFCRIFIKPIVESFFIKEVRGLEYVPRKNFILASNHQSHLDWIASAYPCVPKRFTYIGQVDKYTGFLAMLREFLYSVAGVIRVDRNDERSKKIAYQKAIRSLKRGDVLIIYPEGTRSRTGKIQRAKHGVAKIYLETGVPILPMAIKGTFGLLPPGGRLRMKRVARINIGRPLYFGEERDKAERLDCNSREYRHLLQKITDTLMREIIRLYNEI